VFDIGFSEIVVCAIVALIVIGPERMPEAVRTVGLWIGRFKRSLRETRSEIERQIGVDDIRRQLHNEDIMRSLENARRDMDNVIAQTQQAIDSTADVVNREYNSEPDLPYHSHTEEQAENTAAQLLQPKVALENISSVIDTKPQTSNASTDKKASL
jgi:sec-independent protein translocase protein TatB